MSIQTIRVVFVGTFPLGSSIGPNFIDLGMVSLHDAVLYGRSRSLIPYANGRLIKSIGYVPGGDARTYPGSFEAINFVTPNTSKNKGWAVVAPSIDDTYGTDGLVIQGFGTRVDLSEGYWQIQDAGPLIAAVQNPPNSEYLPLGTWQPNTPYCAADVILDSNGHLQYSGNDNLSGVSGSEEPVWDTEGGSVVDGTLSWTDYGELPSGEIHAIAEVIEGVSPMPPYPASIEFVAQPQGSVAQETMPDFTVLLKDQFGQPYTLTAQTIFISFLGNGVWSAGDGSAGSEGVSDTEPETGIATFTNFAVQDAGTYVIRARLIKSVAADSIDSDPFDVTAP